MSEPRDAQDVLDLMEHRTITKAIEDGTLDPQVGEAHIAPPVRLCCGERHRGPMCRDRKVMCILCFGRFEVQDLNVTQSGQPENICKTCAEVEKLGAIPIQPNEQPTDQV